MIVTHCNKLRESGEGKFDQWAFTELIDPSHVRSKAMLALLTFQGDSCWPKLSITISSVSWARSLHAVCWDGCIKGLQLLKQSPHGLARDTHLNLWGPGSRECNADYQSHCGWGWWGPAWWRSGLAPRRTTNKRSCPYVNQSTTENPPRNVQHFLLL